MAFCDISYLKSHFFRSQFNHGEATKPPGKQKDTTKPSTSRSRKKIKNTKVQESSQGAESWVNPRTGAGNPKDAGKRRVQAVGQSAGRWYTGSDGRRVSSHYLPNWIFASNTSYAHITANCDRICYLLITLAHCFHDRLCDSPLKHCFIIHHRFI